MPNTEQEDLRPLGQRLLREVLETSGLTWVEISARFATCSKTQRLDISADNLRQLGNGRRNVDLGRLVLIARAAEACGWTGPVVKQIPEFAEMFRSSEFLEASVQLEKCRKANKRAMKAAAENLEKALVELMHWGWEQQDLAYMSLAMIEGLLPAHERANGGGIVDPDALPYSRPEDLVNAPLYVSWKLLPAFSDQAKAEMCPPDNSNQMGQLRSAQIDD